MPIMPRVLIVDDDAAVRGILYDLLSDAYDCDTASSADQAFQYLEVETYDAILTDIALPGASGVDLLNHVQLREIDTPVVFISGRGGEQEGEILTKLGAYAFVKKPFELAEVEDVINRAVAQKSRISCAH